VVAELEAVEDDEATVFELAADAPIVLELAAATPVEVLELASDPVPIDVEEAVDDAAVFGVSVGEAGAAVEV